MDIVQQCLALAPVPYLSTAFSLLKFIWTSVQQAQASKEQLRVLATCIAQLLRALDYEYRANKMVPSTTATALNDLSMYVPLLTTSSDRLRTSDLAGC
jgi:hypothetical protein